MKNNLGELIHSRRKSLGLTHDQLAAKIGRSVALVGQIERGQTNPSLETLRRLKSVLLFDLDEVCSSPTPMSAAAFEISFSFRCVNIPSTEQTGNRNGTPFAVPVFGIFIISGRIFAISGQMYCFPAPFPL